MNYIYRYQSPLGNMTMASNGIALIGLWFDHQKYYGSTLDREYEEKTLPVFRATQRWLDLYFCAETPSFMPSYDLKGSDFRTRVWKILLDIPYGKTRSYGDIAKQMAKEDHKEHMSAQAVAGAIAHNPISLIIPCHRVVGSDGSLTGYSGGLDRKFLLLKLEHADMSRLYIPKKK